MEILIWITERMPLLSRKLWRHSSAKLKKIKERNTKREMHAPATQNLTATGPSAHGILLEKLVTLCRLTPTRTVEILVVSDLLGVQ